jgi:hypothetical protein
VVVVVRGTVVVVVVEVVVVVVVVVVEVVVVVVVGPTFVESAVTSIGRGRSIFVPSPQLPPKSCLPQHFMTPVERSVQKPGLQRSPVIATAFVIPVTGVGERAGFGPVLLLPRAPLEFAPQHLIWLVSVIAQVTPLAVAMSFTPLPSPTTSTGTPELSEFVPSPRYSSPQHLTAPPDVRTHAWRYAIETLTTSLERVGISVSEVP